MLRFLGTGTGPIASAEVTRATMLFRANCQGNSGVRLELVERLLELLNHADLPAAATEGAERRRLADVERYRGGNVLARDQQVPARADRSLAT